MNPGTMLVGEAKQRLGFVDNKSPFFSGIIKNNNLFAPEIFDVNKYPDDNTTSKEKIELGQRLFYESRPSADAKAKLCYLP